MRRTWLKPARHRLVQELKDDMRELKDGTRAVLRWCQLTAGFAACASLFAVYPCATC